VLVLRCLGRADDKPAAKGPGYWLGDEGDACIELRLGFQCEEAGRDAHDTLDSLDQERGIIDEVEFRTATSSSSRSS
jgi:hypothetical protein